MIGNRSDGIASLTDSARLTENEIESNRLSNVDGPIEIRTNFGTTSSACKTAHVEVVIGKGIHSNTVAEKCTSRSLPCWVNTEQADFLTRIISLNAEHQFIELHHRMGMRSDT